MSRRSKATRADGRVEIKVSLGKDAAGRRIQRSVYGKTTKEAQTKANELRRALEDGTVTAPRAGTVTMADLADRFETHLDARVAAGNLRPRTRDWYIRMLRYRVVREYGGKRVADVRPSDVETWMTVEGLSGATRRAIYLSVRNALDLAVRDGLVASNPALKVKAPRANSKSPQPAMQHEVDMLLKVADAHMVLPIQVLSLTGLRRGELLAVQWKDIDLEAGTLTIHTSKTDSGRRTLPLSQPLREVLLEQGAHDPAEYLVPNAKDPYQPREARSFSRSFERTAERAGIKVSPHALRHGVTTRLLHAGVTQPTIVKIMGWRSAQMLNTYAHSLPAAEAAAMDVLGGDA